MAFRKRNVAIGETKLNSNSDVRNPPGNFPGTRPSPLTSRMVTSTGTPSLDGILGGHGGLALGSSLLVEENGVTDYAGTLLRFYAAEGICQGHIVHVVGVGEEWIRALPGPVDEKPSSKPKSSPSTPESNERMRIAWRYQNLGSTTDRERNHIITTNEAASESPFNHTFDLTKRLVIGSDARIHYYNPDRGRNPFESIIIKLMHTLKTGPQNAIHRVLVPAILSPALWPHTASQPENFLRFLHSLRVLLRMFPTNLIAIMTLPLELYARSSGLVRWAEHFCDGVLELTPFPHLADSSNALFESGGTRNTDEKPQGMLHVHKLPIVTERGEGGAGIGNSIGEDLAFTVSRKRFHIHPFSLPPLEGDVEAQKEAGKVTAKDVEF